MLNNKFIETNKNNCFLGLEPAKYEDAKFVVLPVPLEKTVCFGSGTSKGPLEIIKTSSSIEFYDIETGSEPQKQGICTLKPLDFEGKSIEESLKIISDIYYKLCSDNKIVFILGGEHSITSVPVSVLKEFYKDFTVIHIDAHTDLRDEYDGTKYSHASVMKRVYDMGIKHVSLGIRSMSKKEAVFAKEKNIPIAYAHDIVLDKSVIDNVLEKIETKNVYISFDVDSLCPSIMPATGTPEPGGLSWYHSQYILGKISKLGKNIIGLDLVELAPIKCFTYPQVTCAKIVFNVMAQGCD